MRSAAFWTVILALSLVDHGSWAASYQMIDGTIVDPIRVFDSSSILHAPTGAPHTYFGINLGPGADLQNAILVSADLSRADLAGAILTGADLRDSNLRGADLRSETLSSAQLGSAWYDADTLFPTAFDPKAQWMREVRVINNGLTPEFPSNVVNDNPFAGLLNLTFVNNQGCDSTIQHPCPAPGQSTAVSGSGEVVVISESSSYSGSIAAGGSLWVRDSATAVTGGPGENGYAPDATFSALDSATLTVTKCYYCESVVARGTSTAIVAGGSWEGGTVIQALENSHVIFSGGTEYGDGIAVSDNALLELTAGGADRLGVGGSGTAILRGGSISWSASVGPNAVLRLVGGGVEGVGWGGAGTVVRGRLEMSGGQIGPGSLRSSGYSRITRGALVAAAVAEGVPEQPYYVPGPWSVFSELTGLIEVSGGYFEDSDGVSGYWTAPRFGAQDHSRIRFFGDDFAVEGQPAQPGSLPWPTGTLCGTLESGDLIDNQFAHRGADCGEQHCTGRILVLAPGLDWDQDVIPNPFDNCAEEPNADQADTDTDGTGDVCFAPVDLDRDSVADALDNCRVDANPDQADADSDGVGDACEESLVVWTDPGTDGCTAPPPIDGSFATVTTDLANGDFIDRAAQPCDCMGLEFPTEEGVASVRFVHLSPTGVVKDVCENAAPFAFGLAPGQALCSTSLAQDGVHAIIATPYDATGCETGGGEASPSSIRRFEVPEPGMGLTIATGVVALGVVARGTSRSA